MDIRAYLAEQGLTAEEIAAVVGNEKTTKAMTAALAKYDEGVSLSTKAQTDLEAANAAKTEAEDFWEKKVTPALAGVDKKVATAASEAARYKAYLQSLKDQGYDVPADLLTAPTTTTTTTTPTLTGVLTREDFNKEMQGTGETLVTLMSLSNRYQDLYGTPYLTGEQDFAEAKAARKPFREFVAGKYKFDDKTKEKPLLPIRRVSTSTQKRKSMLRTLNGRRRTELTRRLGLPWRRSSTRSRKRPRAARIRGNRMLVGRRLAKIVWQSLRTWCSGNLVLRRKKCLILLMAEIYSRQPSMTWCLM